MSKFIYCCTRLRERRCLWYYLQLVESEFILVYSWHIATNVLIYYEQMIFFAAYDNAQ
jgi:hypothetical protein